MEKLGPKAGLKAMESPTLEMRPEETVHFCSVTWENQITQLQLQLG